MISGSAVYYILAATENIILIFSRYTPVISDRESKNYVFVIIRFYSLRQETADCFLPFFSPFKALLMRIIKH